MKNDERVTFAAVRSEPRAFQHCSHQIRNNRTIAMHAVTSQGWLLKFASEGLRDDEEVVVQALNYFASPGTFEYASERLQRHLKHLDPRKKRSLLHSQKVKVTASYAWPPSWGNLSEGP